ncbi:MAG: rod shape-determining protein MreC [Candidatus Berkelbacteria bacterium]|nr:rod shape-determining protein MreC [Candidatus Berkelbacteria bacterium]
MNKNFVLKFILTVGLLIILYLIWPLPFLWVSKTILLPPIEKIGNVLEASVSPFRTLSKISKLDKDSKQLDNENQALEAQIAKLTETNYLCKEVQAEESTLLGKFFTQTARVIGRTPFSFNQTIIVDKGSNDSIKEGAAVLSNGTFIGKVTKVDASRSEVRLITSHDSLIPTILEQSRQTGIVQGGLEGLTLSDVSVDGKISAGENILTSGLGGDLPAGILIGQVSQIIGVEGGLFQSAKVNFPVNISSIEVVSIIK